MRWFTHLQPNSMLSYSRFKKIFIARFETLFDVKRREGKVLHAYIRGFLKATLEVEDLNETTSRHAFAMGLQKGALRMKFKVHRDFTFKKMIEKEIVYVDAESESEEEERRGRGMARRAELERREEARPPRPVERAP